MTRINVSTSWRVNNTNTTFRVQFNEKLDVQKVFEEMKTAVKGINYKDGYCELWLQDLSDNIKADAFEFQSTLCIEEFEKYIPEMCKAIVKVAPSVLFNVYAIYEDMKCFYMDEMEITFDGKKLCLTETTYDEDCGYYCPDCGYKIADGDAEFDTDEIECDDCEESLKVSSLEYIPPTVKKDIIAVR